MQLLSGRVLNLRSRGHWFSLTGGSTVSLRLFILIAYYWFNQGKYPNITIKLLQGSHRLEKYLNIQDCLEKSLKIKFALKST